MYEEAWNVFHVAYLKHNLDVLKLISSLQAFHTCIPELPDSSLDKVTAYLLRFLWFPPVRQGRIRCSALK